MWGLVLGVTNGACSKVQRNSTRCTEVHYCTAASARDGHVAHGNTLPVPCCPTRPCRRPLHEVARARAIYCARNILPAQNIARVIYCARNIIARDGMKYF